ncbi:MAG: hypothetical protein ACP5KG_12440, partial [Myxococcota bacterium]
MANIIRLKGNKKITDLNELKLGLTEENCEELIESIETGDMEGFLLKWIRRDLVEKMNKGGDAVEKLK